MIDPTRAWKVYRYGSGAVDYMPSAVNSSLETVKDSLTLAEAIALTDHLNAERGECRCPDHGRWLAADDIYRMVRELDVAMNGDGAARQATFSDIFPQLLERVTGSAPPSIEMVRKAFAWALDCGPDGGQTMEMYWPDYLADNPDVAALQNAKPGLFLDPDGVYRTTADLGGGFVA